jgi:ribonucleotide reductase alpha subunit
MKAGGRLVETPQYMFMRVALGIHIDDDDDNLSAAFETYTLLSQKWFIHASPTLFQAGTTFPQLSSCFLLGIQADSIEGIYKTLHQVQRVILYYCATLICVSTNDIY